VRDGLRRDARAFDSKGVTPVALPTPPYMHKFAEQQKPYPEIYLRSLVRIILLPPLEHVVGSQSCDGYDGGGGHKREGSGRQ
jgi:hypothetical protein